MNPVSVEGKNYFNGPRPSWLISEFQGAGAGVTRDPCLLRDGRRGEMYALRHQGLPRLRKRSVSGGT